MQGAGKQMVRCGTLGERLIGYFFIDGNLNEDNYLDMLWDFIISNVLNHEGLLQEWFRQDGAPPNYRTNVHQWLDVQFPNSWMLWHCGVAYIVTRPHTLRLSPLGAPQGDGLSEDPRHNSSLGTYH